MNICRKNINRPELIKELNLIKKMEYGNKCFPITLSQIFKFSNPKNTVVRRYKTFKINKKSGGTREISAPHKTLKSILYVLNKYLQNIYEPSPSVMGFVPNKSVVDNAKCHAGHNYVLNMDLENFFSSICEARVAARLQLRPFNFNENLAKTIAGLCAIRIEEGNGKENFVLPQGAPTSPILSNSICDVLDKKLRKIAHKYGAHYSRYADDMTFSSMHNLYQKDSAFLKEVKGAIIGQGFTINEKKTRVQKRGGKQEVTGLTVNEKVNVSTKYVHDLRCVLHIWEKYGYVDAYSRFYPNYKKEKGYIKKGEPILENVIEGKLNYLQMVKGKDDPVYKKLYSRFVSLQPSVFKDKETDKGDEFIHVQSFVVSDFETRFQTKISLRVSNAGTIIARCDLFGKEKFVAISKSTQRWLKVDGKSVNKELFLEIENKFLPTCHITLCRKKAKNFWLITQNELKKNSSVRLNYNLVDVNRLIDEWGNKGLQSAVNLFEQMLINGPVDQNQSLTVSNNKNLSLTETIYKEQESSLDGDGFDEIPT